MPVAAWFEADLAAAAGPLLARPGQWGALDARADPDAAGPWQRLWAARAMLPHDPEAARRALHAAADGFEAGDDLVGALAACTAAIDSHAFDDHGGPGLAGWARRLATHWSDTRRPALPMDLLAHVAGCAPVLALHDPRHLALDAWAEQGPPWLLRLGDTAARVRLATALLHLYRRRGQAARAGWIVDALPAAPTPAVPAAQALPWADALARHHVHRGDTAQALACAQRALALAEAQGWTRLRPALRALLARAALAAGQVDVAARHLQALRVDPHADAMHSARHWHLRAALALARGQAGEAVELARLALSLQPAGGATGPVTAHRITLGKALLAAGHPAQAVVPLEQARTEALAQGASHLAALAAMLASAALAADADLADDPLRAVALRAQADRFLVDGLWLADGHGATALPMGVPADVLAGRLARAMSVLAATAPAAALARAWRLPGPDPLLSAWPWALRLRVFGPFDAEADTRRLTGPGAPPAARPLDLLRVLCVHGGQAGVERIAAALWPEAEADARRKAFDSNLLRLRRLLADDRPLHLHAGILSLDPAWCWCDLAAAEHLLADTLSTARGADARARADLLDRSDRLMALARGPLLDGDDAPWARAARLRWRQRLAGALADLAGMLAAPPAPGEAADPAGADAAVRLFERALDADPQAEGLYRRLMALHLARGHRTAAQRTWRQACALLALADGLGPSDDLRALARRHGLADG